MSVRRRFARPVAGPSSREQQPVHHREVVGRGDLEVARGALDQQCLTADGLERARLVGHDESVRARAASARRRAIDNGTFAASAPATGRVDRRCRPRVASSSGGGALDGVVERDREQPADPIVGHALDQSFDQLDRDAAARGVVDQHPVVVGRDPVERREPVLDRSARVAPPVRTAVTRSLRAAAGTAPSNSASPGAITTTIRSIAATAANASSVRTSIGLPATSTYCFGIDAPAREPVPAAGITAK